MRIKYIIPLVVLICLLTVIIPTTSVEGGEVKADFTITASKIIRPDKYEWETYSNEVLSFDASDSTSARNFTWDFGDGTNNTTTSKFTSHIYSSTGKFQIKLTASDSDGNSNTIYGNITVVEKPLAVLAVKDAKTDAPLAADYNVNVGQAVLFDASGSRGDIKSYYFGYNLRGAFIPQASKNDPTYTYTYTKSGDYRVGLRVVDRLGNKSETPKDQFITITVQNRTITTAYLDSILPNPATKGEVVTFRGHGTGGGGTIVRYVWISSIDGEIYNGTSSEFTTSSLHTGGHIISFRVMNSTGFWSEPVSTILRINAPNQPPTVTITSPTNGSRVSGKVTVSGNASDSDGTVQRVEVSINGGDWIPLTNITNWNYEWDTKNLKNGDYTIRVRAFDGQNYSEVKEITVTVDNREGGGGGGSTPGFGAVGLIAVIAGVGGVAGLISRNKRGT